MSASFSFSTCSFIFQLRLIHIDKCSLRPDQQSKCIPEDPFNQTRWTFLRGRVTNWLEIDGGVRISQMDVYKYPIVLVWCECRVSWLRRYNFRVVIFIQYRMRHRVRLLIIGKFEPATTPLVTFQTLSIVILYLASESFVDVCVVNIYLEIRIFIYLMFFFIILKP